MLEFVTLRSEFCDTYFCVCDTHFRDLGGGRKGADIHIIECIKIMSLISHFYHLKLESKENLTDSLEINHRMDRILGNMLS